MRNHEGHYRIAIEATRTLLGADALMSRIGSVRRTRNRGMYDMHPPEVVEVKEALEDCKELIRLVAVALRQGALGAS